MRYTCLVGAWGSGVFENDDAVAWALELDAGGDRIGFITRTFERALVADGYIEVDDGSAIVAAAATVATDPALSDRPELRRTALAALERVLGSGSELAQLWIEDETFAAATGSLREDLQRPTTEGPPARPAPSRSAPEKARRQRFRPGAMFRLRLGDGTASYARMLAEIPHVAYLDHRVDDVPGSRPAAHELRLIASAPVLFILAGGYGYPGAETDWTAVGTVPLSEIDTPVPPQFVQDRQDPASLRIMDGLGMRPATTDECRGLERAAVWSWEHVLGRLRDHYAGRPNPVTERLALIVP